MNCSRASRHDTSDHPIDRRALLLLLGLLALIALAPADALAQRFGQNKVQYRNFDWRVMRGAHVDVYYYPAEEAIARLALSYAEESYSQLSVRLAHEVQARIPLIVYASHTDFEQTNILPFSPPEGILGVTEFLKGRVAMPFRGSYSEFRHTLRHELVHVFQLSLLRQQFSLYPRARRIEPPLWWSEGLAEYLSSPQDSRDEMVMRDLVVAGRMPDIRTLNLIYSAVVYPIGGDLHHFLADRYGEWRIRTLYTTLGRYTSFEEALRAVYGRSASQLSEEWQYELRRRYYPSVTARRPLSLTALEVSDFAIQPAVVPTTDSSVDVAFISPRNGYTDIYIKPLTGGRARVAVEGERSSEFESLHAFSSRMDAARGLLLFSSKFGDRDALFIWDLARSKVVGRYQFDSLVSIVSPALAPDGRRIAFGGLTTGGVSDLYVLDTRTGAVIRVTDDRFEDSEPTWFPSGERLVFASDRTSGGDEGAKNLYTVSAIAGAAPSPLTAGRWRDESPRWDREAGRIVFTSDRSGSWELYSVDSLGHGRRETAAEGGVFDPYPVPGDPRTVVTGFSGLSWGIYALTPDSLAQRDTFSLDLAAASTVAAWKWSDLLDTAAVSAPSAPYRRRFSLDFASGGSLAQSGSGSVQGGQLYFSDLLGDHEVATSFAFYGSGGLFNLINNLNGDVFYLNRSSRLNWGAGVFRIAGTFFQGDFTQIYSERSAGAYGVLRYPLSRFSRIEAQTRLEYSNRDDRLNALVRGAERRRGVLASNLLSFSTDNSLWLETGPIDGTRFNVTSGVVSDATHGVFENWIASVDGRRYVRTTLRSAVAVRAYGYVSEGVRPRAVQIGGSWLLRGYPRFGVAGTHAWVANSEFRFPITNFVALGLPVGGAIRFPALHGAVFADGGQAWYASAYNQRILASAGVSLRTALIPGVVLRLDIGRRYSLRGSGGDRFEFVPSFYSARFVDFFFGFNY